MLQHCENGLGDGLGDDLAVEYPRAFALCEVRPSIAVFTAIGATWNTEVEF